MSLHPLQREWTETVGVRTNLRFVPTDWLTAEKQYAPPIMKGVIKGEMFVHMHACVPFVNTVEPVLRDRPICHWNVVSQDRWSLMTGFI